ncbi:hypothetical protein [Mesorhizobium sp. SP-1A]|uniref:HNH endonuclease signature motif containing protein n=1 Tax=Mesorhizobium sp. SP-1A TaxID=3077840 RepID=UPI0028F74DD5|nr:hypothetical protein [Mesorhizobium sp. SP-1A]
MKLFKNIFIASIVSASMLMPQIAEAGKISKAVGAYTTYKAIQGAAKVGKAAKGAAVIVKEAPKFRGDLRRYIRQMEQYSGRKISKSQLTELKKCLRDPKCYTGKKHPDDFVGKTRTDALKEWARDNNESWPRYTKEVPNPNGGRPLAKIGDNYDGHHIIPKSKGGPHKGWNMLPVPKPYHMGKIHLKNSPLSKMLNKGKSK